MKWALASSLLLCGCGPSSGGIADLGSGGTDGGAVFSCPALPPCATSSFGCVPTLADAMSHFCGSGYTVTVYACGSYQRVRLAGIDSLGDYYYDANGALVAEVASGFPSPGGDQCTGGPPMFTVPACQPPRAFCP